MPSSTGTRILIYLGQKAKQNMPRYEFSTRNSILYPLAEGKCLHVVYSSGNSGV